MGLRMLWFAFGSVLSDALFQDFFTVPACLPQISKQLNGAPTANVQDAFQTYQTESYWSFNIKHRHIIGQYWRSMPDFRFSATQQDLAGCWGEKYLFLSKMMFFVFDIGFSIRSATHRRMRRMARRLARYRPTWVYDLVLLTYCYSTIFSTKSRTAPPPPFKT